MTTPILITASDAGFFDLLRGLLRSIETHRGEQEVSIGVLDLGLSRDQRVWLEERVTHIVEPGWDLEVPQEQREANPLARGLTARPFLPRYFPGYETYMWIDADVWLQDWRGVELYLTGVRRGCFTIATHSDRAYRYHPAYGEYFYRDFAAGYGEKFARAVTPHPQLNAGIFAARPDAPIWERWAETYQEGISRSGGTMLNDQCALNVAFYRQPPRTELLSALYNWQCHLMLPYWDPNRGKFCEPYLPNDTISMLHLTDITKNEVFDICGLDGRIRRMRLRYPDRRKVPETAE